MAQRILIASGNPWAFCMAAERDIARSHREAKVDAINLFTLCSRSSPHWRPRDKIIETLNRKIERFVMPVINGRDITGDLAIDDELPPLPATYDALRAYELDGAKIGLAVLSSVSSLTTIQNPSGLEEFGHVLEPAWRSAHISLRIGQAVRALGYDKVVIFNGRHCYSRPFCDVLDGTCEVVRYEQGSAGNRYIAAPFSIQEPRNAQRLIDSHYYDPEAGEAFFQERLERQSGTDVGLYTATQEPGTVPQGLKERKTVAFFTSSSDETFAVTDEPPFGRFATQNHVALALCDICDQRGLQLIVRLHPHLRFKHDSWRREWDFTELERRGVIVLEPDDPSDSYAIVRASHAVVTTGSTIGVEATYLGVPNAVVGKWVGGCLGASTEVEDVEELARFIGEPELPPKAREKALLFGSFFNSAGKPLPELDVSIHPNLARIGGRVVDRIRYAVQKVRYLFSAPPAHPAALDIKSGISAGRVMLAVGTDYSSALRKDSQGKAARSGPTKSRLAATENSRSRE